MAKKEAKPAEADPAEIMEARAWAALAKMERAMDGEAPQHMHGVLNFPVGLCPLAGELNDLADGAYRLENGRWQFEFRDGDLVKAVRLDMAHYLNVDETVVPSALPQPSQEADRGEGGEGAEAS